MGRKEATNGTSGDPDLALVAVKAEMKSVFLLCLIDEYLYGLNVDIPPLIPLAAVLHMIVSNSESGD